MTEEAASGTEARPAGGRVAILAVLLLALSTLAGGMRFIYTAAGTRLDGEFVSGMDPDAHYHLRRIEFSAANHGRALTDDAFANAPKNFRCGWPVVFDYLVLALDAVVFSGVQDPEGLVLVACLLPLLLGILATLVALLVLLPRTSLAAAAAGALFVAVARPALSVTSFGMIDHHPLELLFFMLIPAAFAQAVSSRRRLPAAVLGALAFGLGILSADAVYLVIVATGAAALLIGLGERKGWVAREALPPLRAFLVGGLGGVAAASALELLLGLPRALSHSGRLGLMLAVTGVGFAAGRRGRGLALAVAATFAGVALASPVVLVGLGFLGARDAISAHNVQALPIWSGDFGAPMAVALLLLAVALAWHRRREVGDALSSTLAVGGALIAIAQVKYWFLLAWTGAWVIAHGCAFLLDRVHGRAAVPLRILLAATAIGYAGTRVRDEILDAPAGVASADATFAELARKIRERTPAQGPLSPDARPGWTIVAGPEQGPRLLHLAGRAVTAMPFWADADQLDQYRTTLRALIARDEGEALAQLQRLKARYVLTSDMTGYSESMVEIAGIADYERGARSRDWAYSEALWHRLHVLNGAAAREGMAALHHFRQVAAASREGVGFELFERVAGARLEGKGPPSTRLLVSARIQSLDGPAFPWAASAAVDPAGHFTVIVPYATTPATVNAWASEAHLHCATGSIPLVIGEAAVVGGGSIAVDCPIKPQ